MMRIRACESRWIRAPARYLRLIREWQCGEIRECGEISAVLLLVALAAALRIGAQPLRYQRSGVRCFTIDGDRCARGVFALVSHDGEPAVPGMTWPGTSVRTLESPGASHGTWNLTTERPMPCTPASGKPEG